MNKRDLKLLSIFENIEQDEKIIDSTIKIQNNINIYADSKVIAISMAKFDIALAVAARTIAEVYKLQNQKTLLIDCDMYNPSLNNIFNNDNIDTGLNNIIDNNVDVDKLISHFSNNLDVVFTNKTNYPTEIFKSKQYNEFICMSKEKYDHIILIMPAIVEHQDILLNKDLITASMLVARKNKVSKKDLFDSIQFLKLNNISYVGTIFLK